MRDLNLGVHKLGPGGYRVAELIWDKEDAERAEQGLPPLFDKYFGVFRDGTHLAMPKTKLRAGLIVIEAWFMGY